jgi:lysophospholipase L1-like esterase
VELAERRGAQYVDLWPALADATGALRKEFTPDNLHLLPAGYRAWSGVLRPLLST